MAWTYDVSLLDQDLHYVRFALGDTDTAWQLVQDEEINTELGNVTAGQLDQAKHPRAKALFAAASLSEALAAKFSRQVDESTADLKLTASQRKKHFIELAGQLRMRARGAQLRAV